MASFVLYKIALVYQLCLANIVYNTIIVDAMLLRINCLKPLCNASREGGPLTCYKGLRKLHIPLRITSREDEFLIG